jgi:hypothetical protein
MYERFGHTARQLVVEYLTALFSYQQQWTNTDRPKISLTGQNTPDIFEEFAKEPEKYPCIIVGNRGSQQSATSIDGYIDQVAYTEPYGVYASTYSSIGDGAMVANKCIPLANATWHGVMGTFSCSGGPNDRVMATLVSGSSIATGTILTSGSVEGFTDRAPVEKTIMFTTPQAMWKGATAWVRFEVDGGGSYYVFGDNSLASGSATRPQYVVGTLASGSTWQITSGSTYLATITDRAHHRRGATKTTNIELAIWAKDQVAADSISDVCVMYLELARRARLTKLSDIGVSNSMIVDNIGEFLKKGLAISEIKKSGTTAAKRGQDNLFKITLSVGCFSMWYDDYSADYLEDIIYSSTNY